jgi:hypothetical protein
MINVFIFHSHILYVSVTNYHLLGVSKVTSFVTSLDHATHTHTHTNTGRDLINQHTLAYIAAISQEDFNFNILFFILSLFYK